MASPSFRATSPCAASSSKSPDDPTAGNLEADAHRTRIVDPQHRLLQEVVLVARADGLDLQVALLAGVTGVEQHEDEAGLTHDLTPFAELAEAGEERESVGEAGRHHGFEELRELRRADLRQTWPLAAEEQLGADERVAVEAA